MRRGNARRPGRSGLVFPTSQGPSPVGFLSSTQDGRPLLKLYSGSYGAEGFARDARLVRAAYPVVRLAARAAHDLVSTGRARYIEEDFLGGLFNGIKNVVKSVGGAIKSGIEKVGGFIQSNPILGGIVQLIPGVGDILGVATQLLPGEAQASGSVSTGGALDEFSIPEIAMGIDLANFPNGTKYDSWEYIYFPPFEQMAVDDNPATDPRTHYATRSWYSVTPDLNYKVWNWMTHQWETISDYVGMDPRFDKKTVWGSAYQRFLSLKSQLATALQNGSWSYDERGNLYRSSSVGEQHILPVEPPLTPVSTVVVPPASQENMTYSWTKAQAAEVARNALQVYAAHGPEYGLYYIFENFPPMQEVLGALRRIGRPATSDMAYYTASRCDACPSMRGFLGRLPTGPFYSGRVVTASVSNRLGDGIYGQVDLSELPFRIDVSSKHGTGRARVALAHELAHVADQLYKLGLSHPQVHDLGVFFASEGIPALRALEQQAKG